MFEDTSLLSSSAPEVEVASPFGLFEGADKVNRGYLDGPGGGSEGRRRFCKAGLRLVWLA